MRNDKWEEFPLKWRTEHVGLCSSLPKSFQNYNKGTEKE